VVLSSHPASIISPTSENASSGASYDLDRHDLLKKYEGQKVKIHGTLDSTGKMIQVK
jgi:hypothetical protein